MPDIVRGAPEPGTYRYVVCRWDWPSTQTYSVANYGETRTTRIVDWPESWELPDGRGNPNTPTRDRPGVPMAFIQDRHLRDRCLRFGWHDISDRWFHLLNHPDDGPTPGVAVGNGLPGPVIATIGKFA